MEGCISTGAPAEPIEQLMPVVRGGVLPILDLQPRRPLADEAIRTRRPLGDHPLEVQLACEPEELGAAPAHVRDVADPAEPTRDDAPEEPLAIDEGPLAQVLPLEPEEVEGAEVRQGPPVEERGECWPAVGAEAGHFAVEHGRRRP